MDSGNGFRENPRECWEGNHQEKDQAHSHPTPNPWNLGPNSRGAGEITPEPLNMDGKIGNGKKS